MVIRQWNLILIIGSITKRHCLAPRRLCSNGFSCKHRLFVGSHPIVQSMADQIRRNKPLEALRLFMNHYRYYFMNEVTLALACKACSHDLHRGSQLHCLAIVSGLMCRVTVANSLMSMYSKCQMLGNALSIFDKLPSPDIVSWNIVLSGFHTSEEAFLFILRMSSSGISFDAFTYTTALSFCLAPHTFPFAQQLHCCVEKFGFDCDVFVGNAFTTMYSRLGSVHESRKVFDTMPWRDRVSWCAMITAYAQEVIYAAEAIILFFRMIAEGMKLDHVAFTGAISACGHEKNLLVGRLIHALSTKYGCANHLSVGNVLMSMYSKTAAPEEVSLVFGDMNDRNVVSWTTMISVYEEDALSLFKKMINSGVAPNDITFLGLLSALTDGKFEEQGKMIHGYCTKCGFLSDPNVCSSLITMYAHFAALQESRKIFEEIEHKDIIAWNSLISGHVHNRQYHEALHTFLQSYADLQPSEYTFGSVLSAISSAEDASLVHGQKCHSQIYKLGLSTHPIVSNALLDMYAKRGSICDSQQIFADTPQQSQFSWTALISAYARHGDVPSVLRSFQEMKSHGVIPDSITFLSILAACGRKGMVDIGYRVFESMINDYQIAPNQEHCSCMVDMMGRAGRLEEAEAMLDSMPGKPGLTMLQSLLGSCRIHGNASMGERVADLLLEMEPADSGSYVLMSNIYAEKGLWEKVARVRRVMREKGVRKEVGFSWLDMGEIDASNSAFLHKFSAGDKTHKQSQEILGMAQCLGLEMKLLWDKDGGCWLSQDCQPM